MSDLSLVFEFDVNVNIIMDDVHKYFINNIEIHCLQGMN